MAPKKAAAAKKEKATAPRKEKKGEEIATVRDPLVARPLPSGTSTFKCVSWNVNGLRAAIKTDPKVLQRLAEEHRPDLICLQETKLQVDHVPEMRALDLVPGYKSVWNCSTVKKGYSGTVVFFPKQAEPWQGEQGGTDSGDVQEEGGHPRKRQKQSKMSAFLVAGKPKGGKASKGEAEGAEGAEGAGGSVASDAASSASGGEEGKGKGKGKGGGGKGGAGAGPKVLSVRFGIGDTKHTGEGRAITVEYPQVVVVSLYVPNSGMKLERLAYRTQEWDAALRAYVAGLERDTGKPVLITGDLNVAHLDLDIYNSQAKHIKKTAGCTPEERASLTAWLEGDSGGGGGGGGGCVKDAFRHFHATARGAYTYWSMRTKARPDNRGLRLDHVLCSPSLLPETREEGAEGEKGKEQEEAEQGAGSEPGGDGGGPGGGGGVRVHDCQLLPEFAKAVSDHCPITFVVCL